jgi:hypothetical protein
MEPEPITGSRKADDRIAATPLRHRCLLGSGERSYGRLGETKAMTIVAGVDCVQFDFGDPAGDGKFRDVLPTLIEIARG